MRFFLTAFAICLFISESGCKKRAASSLESSSESPDGYTVDDLAAEVDFYADLVGDETASGIDAKLIEQARHLVFSGEYSQAVEVVNRVKVQFLAKKMEGLRYGPALTSIKDRGFFGPEMLGQLQTISVHIQEAVHFASNGRIDPQIAFTGLILLDNLLQLYLLEGDSEFYAFAADIRPLSRKSEELLIAWDGHRNGGVSEAAQLVETAKSLNNDFMKIRSQYVVVKQKEMTASRIIRLGTYKYGRSQAGNPLILNDDQIAFATNKFDNAGTAFQSKETDRGNQLVDEAVATLFPADLRGKFTDQQLFTLLSLQTAGNYLSKQCSQCDRGRLMEYNAQISGLTKGDEAEFNEAVGRAKKLLDSILSSGIDENTKADFFAKIFPEILIDRFSAQLSAFMGLVRSTRLKVYENDGKKTALDALNMIQRSLVRLYTRSHFETDIRYIVGISSQQHRIQLVIFNAIDAALNNSSTAPQYAQVLETAVNAYSAVSGRLLSDAAYKDLRALSNDELVEQKRQAWVDAFINVDMAVNAAFSAVLISEVVTFLPSGGASSLAMPATLAAMRGAVTVAGRVAVKTAVAVIVAGSAIRIKDRFDSNGIVGLLNTDTAFDVLNMLVFLPRMPLPGRAKPGFINSVTRSLQQGLSSLRYSSIRSLSVGIGLVGGYQLWCADAIAAEMAKQGYPVSPWEIRRRSVINIAGSAFAWSKNVRYLRNQKIVNPVGAAELSKSMSLRESFLARRLRGALNPWRAGVNFYQAQPSWYRGIAGGAVGVGYAIYDYVLINEAILMSYVNPDGNFKDQIEKKHPFPALKDGETALAVTGFDPTDVMMYLGSFAQATHRREQELYKGRYDIEKFTSPDNLIEVIGEHAKKHGKIKYLKIMTHGQPGRLFTRASSLGEAVISNGGGQGSGWIDAAWFETNKSKIQAIARDAFADDARIVVFACLVGSNLDYVNKEWETIKGGDTFMQLLGETFLVNGGAIDSSKRALLGLELAYGETIRNATTTGIKESSRRMVPLVDMGVELAAGPIPGRKPMDLSGLSVSRVGDTQRFFQITLGEPEPIDLAESASHTAGQLTTMLYRLPEVWMRFGVQLEGPWWENRYAYLEVPKH